METRKKEMDEQRKKYERKKEKHGALGKVVTLSLAHGSSSEGEQG
jgi:hypothetical protein